MCIYLFDLKMRTRDWNKGFYWYMYTGFLIVDKEYCGVTKGCVRDNLVLLEQSTNPLVSSQ